MLKLPIAKSGRTGGTGKYGNLHYELAAWGLGELLRSKKDLLRRSDRL